MSTSAQPVRLARPEKKRRRIPIAVIMALSFGSLVFLSVGGVLALSVGANFRNTFDLLGAQSTLLIDAMEDSLRAEMGDAENAVDGIAQLYAQGEFQIDDEAMSAAVAGALAAASGVEATLICTPTSSAAAPRGPSKTTFQRARSSIFRPSPRSRPKSAPPSSNADRSTDANGVRSWPTSSACTRMSPCRWHVMA